MATRGRKGDSLDAGRAFFKRLATEGAWAPVYVLYGEERFLVDEAVARLNAALFPDAPDDFNLSRYHGGEASGADIASAAEQLPMFAPRRLVVVRSAHRLSAKDMEAVADYCDRPADTTLLVIEGTKFDKRQKAVSRVFKAPGVVAIEFPELRERDAAQWVARRAATRRLEIARDLPSFLVEAVGASLSQLDLALEKIDLYAGSGPERPRVTVDLAAEVVSDVRVRSVFELTDRLAERQLDQAVGCFRRMLEQGESPIGALAMIARQFRQLLLLHDGLRRGLRDRELASAAGVPPFRVRDATAAAQRFPPEQLRGILNDILRTDHALKSARLSRELLVERLFVRICAQ